MDISNDSLYCMSKYTHDKYIIMMFATNCNMVRFRETNRVKLVKKIKLEDYISISSYNFNNIILKYNDIVGQMISNIKLSNKINIEDCVGKHIINKINDVTTFSDECEYIRCPNCEILSVEGIYKNTHKLFGNKLRNVTLCCNYENICAEYWPKCIKKLVMKKKCTNINTAILPKTLRILDIICDRNTSLDNLPTRLKKLTVNFNENVSIYVDKLPNSLTSLYLSFYFNESIDNLPQSLKILDLGYSFNKPIDKLPQSLKILDLGYSFNKPIDKLPYGLERLSLHGCFDQSIDNLPATLRILEISGKFNKTINKLPNNLQKLLLGDDFDQSVDNLPQSLQTLIIGNNFNHPVDNLPISLNKLKLGKSFNKKIDNLPYSLEKLIIVSDKFNQKIDKLPDSIIELLLGNAFNCRITKLPKKLKKLSISNRFYQRFGFPDTTGIEIKRINYDAFVPYY